MSYIDWVYSLGPEALVGETVTAIFAGNDEVQFKLGDGRVLVMGHEQDCCETVTMEDVVGDWGDLLNTPILVAEERSNDAELMQALARSHPDYGGSYDSETWTFYTFRTIKGSVDVRWLGTSNGYYSERVDWGWRRSPEAA